jgi:hypothetical protein
MNYRNIATVLVSGVVVLMPQLVSQLPPVYRELATAIVGVLIALFHLWEPSPAQQEK